jgi:D-xylose 1-dehydrogenase
VSPFATYPSLKGKVVFVTGGAMGIGAALVESFHAQGASVAFVDRAEAAGQALAARLPGCWFAPCDVTNSDALQAAITRTAKDLGAIGILINNVANDTRHDAAETSAQAWRAHLAVNLDPTFVAATAVQPGMAAAGGGVIINFSSITALLGASGLPAYVAAKGAILSLTKALAREWGIDNIRVNAIVPGWIVTERQLELWLTPEAEAEHMKLVALKRRLMPEEVARLALFLASEDASAITGQNFVIDGGRT